MTNKYNNLLHSIENFKKHFDGEYTYLPVADEQDIISFENKFDLKLPEDFRWVLLNVANGIVSSESHGWDLFCKIDFKEYLSKEKFYSNPSLPFLLTTKVKCDEPYINDAKSYQDEINHEDYSHGNITLVGMGCGTAAMIIINGKEYGNVWIEDIPSNNEIYPEFDKKKNKPRLKFHEWLEYQISQKIQYKLDMLRQKRQEQISAARAAAERNSFKVAHKRHSNKIRNDQIVRNVRAVFGWILGTLLLIHFLRELLK